MSSNGPLTHVSRKPQTKGSGKPPAVILIHGRGADEKDLLPIAKRLPDEVYIFSVRGPIEMEDGYAWYHLNVKQGGLHNSQPQTKSFKSSVKRLAKFISYISKKYTVDPNRIGLLGFSQGGTLGIATAIEQPDRVAFLAALNAYLPDAYRSAEKLVDARPVPMFLSAGRMDLVTPQERVERARDRMRDVGIDIDYELYNSGHGADEEQIKDVVKWIQKQL